MTPGLPSSNTIGMSIRFCLFPRLDENNMARLRVTPDGKFIVFLGAYGNMHLIAAKVLMINLII